MSRAIWKFPLSSVGSLTVVYMPKGAIIRRFAFDVGHAIPGRVPPPTIWAECQPDAPREMREFQLIMTGEKIHDSRLQWIGTDQHGGFVGHCFERIAEGPAS